MSIQIKYSGAEEKIIQKMTSWGNNCMGLFASYTRENGIIYRIPLISPTYISNKPCTKPNVGAAFHFHNNSQGVKARKLLCCRKFKEQNGQAN